MGKGEGCTNTMIPMSILHPCFRAGGEAIRFSYVYRSEIDECAKSIARKVGKER